MRPCLQNNNSSNNNNNNNKLPNPVFTLLSGRTMKLGFCNSFHSDLFFSDTAGRHLREMDIKQESQGLSGF